MSNNVPFFYDYVNSKVAPITPNYVHQQNTGVFRYFQRYLLQKAMSVFDFCLPETWEKNYFLYVLYCWGYLVVSKTQQFGVIPQFGTLSGYNVYYQPTTANISNPLIQDNERMRRIGVDCTIIRLQPDWGGIMDLVNYYAAQMATISTTFEQNQMSAKLAAIFFAKDKAAGEAWKKLYDKIMSGDPAAVIDKSLFDAAGGKAWEIFNSNVKQTYIGAELLDDLRTVENRFCTAVGIPNANTDKRERLISDEVNANNTETRSLASLWLDELRKGIEQTNAMFGLDISVDWRDTIDEGSESNAQLSDDNGLDGGKA